MLVVKKLATTNRNNSRFYSRFKACSPLQFSCNLTGKSHMTGYCPYNKHVARDIDRALATIK